MDHAGFSTYDSIFRARDVFAADKIIIVTQEYHLYRALHIANALGVFDGGNLSVIKTELFDEIVSYTATFYTLEDEAQRTLMSNSVVDFTGGMIHVEEDLGQMSGDGFIIGGKVESIDELQENLWFELKTTDLNGEEEVYKIQLTLSEQSKLDN